MKIVKTWCLQIWAWIHDYIEGHYQAGHYWTASILMMLAGTGALVVAVTAIVTVINLLGISGYVILCLFGFTWWLKTVLASGQESPTDDNDDDETETGVK